jgi:hypothetical protein
MSADVFVSRFMLRLKINEFHNARIVGIIFTSPVRGNRKRSQERMALPVIFAEFGAA